MYGLTGIYSIAQKGHKKDQNSPMETTFRVHLNMKINTLLCEKPLSLIFLSSLKAYNCNCINKPGYGLNQT